MNTGKNLNNLRNEIDDIDDSIHNLIMRRTKVVKKVREIKRDEKIKIRPAREAEIIYRLMRRHQGDFPRRELCRIWRELIVATLAMEGPFSMAVFTPQHASGWWDLARDQYGAFTPMTKCQTERQVIDAVAAQRATVGILPLPSQDDQDPWWRHLMNESPETPRIIAKLPFAGVCNSRGANVQALVICPLDHQPNKYNRDHCYFAIESSRNLALDHLTTVLALQNAVIVSSLKAKDKWLCLVETGEYRENINATAPIDRVVCLGGFALPLSDQELDAAGAKT